MGSCVYCHQRKGKRPCPALAGLICSICCGTHRGRAIACPTDCIYYIPGVAYQRERSGHLFFKARQSLYETLYRAHGEQAVVILNLIDFACYRYGVNRSTVSDQELLAGLEEVRAKLSPLTVPAAALIGSCAQQLWGVVETWLKHEQWDRELVRSVLDQAIAFGRTIAGEELASQTFLTGLIGMIDERFPEQAKQFRAESQSTSKIILPAEAARSR